jgi:hypothetical protein
MYMIIAMMVNIVFYDHYKTFKNVNLGPFSLSYGIFVAQTIIGMATLIPGLLLSNLFDSTPPMNMHKMATSNTRTVS